MIIRWEPLLILLNDGLQKLVTEHWEEAGLSFCKLNVDWPRYGLLEQEEIIRWIGIREENKLIGYASICVTHPLHHKNDKAAMYDTIFLTKDFRKGMAGGRVVDAIERLLCLEGVDILTISERQRVGKNGIGLGDILRRKGYAPYETGWIKVLGV